MLRPGKRSLDARVAIVTGASRGIGRASAQRLASAGATVVIAARSLTTSHGATGTLAETADMIAAAGGQAISIVCDVEDAASRAQLVAETIARTGRLDILVNNAGQLIYEKLETFTPDKAMSLATQYLLAPFDLARLVLPQMRRRGAGWIINLGSFSAATPEPPYSIYTTSGGAALYAALKAGVHRLTVSLAAELLADNISVNTVAPVAGILTPGVDILGIVKPGMEDSFEPVEHIAEATLALVEAEPRSLTGQTAFSYIYLDKILRSTWSLDGTRIFQIR
jgi:3-oxoacyl-[acyl-carrier protein] reductase